MVIDKLQLVWSSFPNLLEGALLTIQLTIAGLGLGIILGLSLAFGQIYGNYLIRGLVSVYEQVLRSILLLVILFLKEAIEKFLECGDYPLRGSLNKIHKSRL